MRNQRANFTDESLSMMKRKAARFAKSDSGFQAAVSLDRMEPTIELLNSMAVLQGRIQFKAVRRRASMIIATTTEGIEIVWPSAKELAKFHDSRAIIADATGIFKPTPPPRFIRAWWEPVASLLLRLAATDGIVIENAQREETREWLRLMWRQSGPHAATDGKEFIGFMRSILKSRRDPRGEAAPPSVFIAEEYTARLR
jgi:hypothetical protein